MGQPTLSRGPEEVDFLLFRGGRFVLAECKWTESPERRDLSSVDRLAGELREENVSARLLVARTAPRQLGSAQVLDLPRLADAASGAASASSEP